MSDDRDRWPCYAARTLVDIETYGSAREAVAAMARAPRMRLADRTSAELVRSRIAAVRWCGAAIECDLVDGRQLVLAIADGAIAWQLHAARLGAGVQPDLRFTVPCRLSWLTNLSPNRVEIAFDPDSDARRLRHAEVIQLTASGAAITELHVILPDGTVVELGLWPLRIEPLGIDILWWQLGLMPRRRDPLPPR